jgi:thiamine biosynthesis lipoprotein
MKSLSQKFKRMRPMLGTYVTIELQGDVEEQFLHECMTEGFEAIAEVENRMSYHREDSDLTRLNQAKRYEWVEVHPDTISVLRASNQLFLVSSGVFDIRCAKVLTDQGVLPNFFEGQHGNSNQDEIILPVEIDGVRVRKSGPWLLDLGGIAKGYAVDCATRIIQHMSKGCELSGLVNAGGDLFMWGEESLATAIRIDCESSSWLQPLEIGTMAVATSSVRTSSVLSRDLSKASHVRMPKGELLKEAQTVTVFAPECLLADALTKVVLLGSTELTEQCLSFYKARAFLFGPTGQLKKAIY